MNTTELLARRRPEWQELEMLLTELGQFRQKPLGPDKIARFTTLYRCVCSDLALAESQQLPAEVIQYLNDMVGKAHHELYRNSKAKRFQFRKTVFEDIPRGIVSDKIFWFAFLLFWLPFFFCASAARLDPLFPERTIGQGSLEQIQKMYSRDMSEKSSPVHRFEMFGFYINNNGGIGLKCFALGILGGFIGAYILLSNSISLGTIYGFMSSSAVDENISKNFTTFVTAHSIFELTAIILSAAAGMRLGFAFFSTNGFRRLDSVRLAAHRATPIAFFAFVLFCLAALLEGFVSPNPYIPYFAKVEIAVLSAGLLFFYIVICGLLALRKKNSEADYVSDNSNPVGSPPDETISNVSIITASEHPATKRKQETEIDFFSSEKLRNISFVPEPLKSLGNAPQSSLREDLS